MPEEERKQNGNLGTDGNLKLLDQPLDVITNRGIRIRRLQAKLIRISQTEAVVAARNESRRMLKYAMAENIRMKRQPTAVNEIATSFPCAD
jgi:hypothetical protein